MCEESTTPSLVELARRSIEAGFRGDFDGTMSFYAPDAAWDLTEMGIGTFEGVAAIRSFFEDWIGAFDEFEIELEETHDLGNGVVLGVIRQNARPVRSARRVETRQASVIEWTNGLIVRVTQYNDIDHARAAAERLAEERG